MKVVSLAVVAVVCFSLWFVAGRTGESGEPADAPSASAQAAEKTSRENPSLSKRDAELIRFLLREHDRPADDRIYFLTTTPMSKWGETGDWRPLPDSFMRSISTLKTKYRPANEAELKNGFVLEKNSAKESWMRWITIKRWISDTQVEVENGVWCCPLGGGASTITYEKVDGQWRIKALGEMWVS